MSGDRPSGALRRIAVVGVSGSGKTTLAREIAARLDIDHVELDALHWEPNWTGASLDVFRRRTAEALAGTAWVTDGNYSKVRDLVWSRADTVVWLDYPLRVPLWRVTTRTVRRIVTREVLWNTNRETVREALLSRYSLPLWVLRTYRKRRREYPILLNRLEYAHLKLVRLRTPRQAHAWLEGLADRARTPEPG